MSEQFIDDTIESLRAEIAELRKDYKAVLGDLATVIRERDEAKDALALVHTLAGAIRRVAEGIPEGP